MERSRFRTLLGLALLVIGIALFSHRLIHAFMPAHVTPPPIPAAAPRAPGADVLPDPSSDPAIRQFDALPDVPPAPAMPPIPAIPPLPPLPDLPALPPAPAPAHQFPFHPALIVLGIVLLLTLRRRARTEQPVA